MHRVDVFGVEPTRGAIEWICVMRPGTRCCCSRYRCTCLCAFGVFRRSDSSIPIHEPSRIEVYVMGGGTKETDVEQSEQTVGWQTILVCATGSRLS